MLKLIVLISLFIIQPMFAWAESDISDTKTVTEIHMSALDAVNMAGKLVDMGDYEHASQILTMMPETDNTAVETERWYLLAQIFQRNGDYDDAIKIYREILDERPDLAKVRYELALCYMAKEQWYRADYQLRL
ncbi:MAG: tetratricopeptide repeat protein, partial [Alphaproteobacteria bacterium]|nr:tetratricopeptide repeat protein [Alphaproteobacteria bacterium]